MEAHSFDFCFKGNRTYVHGTDIYNRACTFLHQHLPGELTNLDMTIRQISRHNLNGTLYVGKMPMTAVSPAVTFRFESLGQSHTLTLVENDSHITCRYEYDEDSIAASGIISEADQKISFDEALAFSPIEIIVALNKKLVQTLLPDPPGKWYFTRLSVSCELEAHPGSLYELALSGTVGGRFTRTRVSVDGTFMGEVFFSKVLE